MKLTLFYLYDRAGRFLDGIYAVSAEDAVAEFLLRNGVKAYYALKAKERNK